MNARFLGRPLTGVERYAREITSRLGARITLHTPARSTRGLRGHLWEQLVLPRRLGPGGLLWSPANSGPLSVRRQVVTIHDLSPIEHPDWYARGFARWHAFLLPRLAARCLRIITDSAFCKARMLELLGVAEEKVAVIPLGVGASFRPSGRDEIERVRAKYSLPARYVLAIGPPGPRKNVAAVLGSWPRVHARFPAFGLVFVGAGDRHFLSAVPSGAARGVSFVGRVADDDLPAVYSGASAFVLASLYEGFGLPILEAMACGVPIVASNRSALPEVVGGAGLLVDPSEPESIAAGLIRVLSDDGLGAELRERGALRAAAFSWDRTAEQTWRVLGEAAAA